MFSVPPRLVLTALLVATLVIPTLRAQRGLSNLSVRAAGAGSGEAALALNFQVEGTSPKPILIRAVGPGLAPFGISGVMADPMLSIYGVTGAFILSNNDWGGTNELRSAFATVGAFTLPDTSRDAAILVSAPPGIHTVRVEPASGADGVVLLEIYETDATPRLVYLSVRGRVATGSNNLIAGVSVNAATSASILVRAVGPGLGTVGVTNFLANPMLSIFRNATPLGTNDDWGGGTAINSAATTAGLIPLAPTSADSALLLTLTSGAYSAQVTGQSGGTGVAWLEFAHADAGRAASFAPALTLPPAPVSAAAGTNVTISAPALGRPAPSYQWRKDGTNLAGATSPALTLSNVQTANAGSYTVVLGNSFGSITSAPWVLTVTPPVGPPVITTQPTAVAAPIGGTATFSVTAAGATPLSYQWFKDGVLIANATSATLAVTNVQSASVGAYAVRVTNALGSVSSNAAPLTIAISPTLTSQPVPQSVPEGTTARFTVTASGSPPLSYQWRKDGNAIAGATGSTLTLTTTVPGDAGSYTCVVTGPGGTVTSAAAVLTITRNYAGTYFGTFDGGRGNWAMVITADGTGTFVAFVNNPRGGIIVTFRVDPDGRFRTTSTLIQGAATGAASTGRPIAAAGPEFTLSGSINASNGVSGSLEGLNIPLTGTKDTPNGETSAVSGIYQANGANNTTVAVVGNNRQVVALTIGATTVDGGIGTIGGGGAFTVTTTNNTTVNGTISAGTGAVTGTVSTGGAAVAVTGTATGGLGPPTITSTATAQTVVRDGIATFSVTAGGKTPLAYQWRKDGANIPGATAATYSIASAQVANAGSYTCVVTNSEGSATSAPIPLTVTIPGPTARLVNLSIFTELTSASDSFTMGYVLSADPTGAPKPLVIRAAGPSLSALGVTGTVADPKLETFAGQTKTGENDDWGGGPATATAMSGVGAFAYSNPTSKDAAVVTNIGTTDNSVRISATGGGSIIAEIYDATPNDAGGRRLANVSVLKPIGGGLTAGFVIGGTGTTTVLIRAVGPTLATAFNVDGALADPQLTLFSGQTSLRSNDNWGGTPELSAAFSAVGAFALPAASRDAALLATLEPGNYSVRVTGVGNTTGTAIVEVYEVP